MPKNAMLGLMLHVVAAVLVALGITALVVKAADMLYAKPQQIGRGYTIQIANAPVAASAPSDDIDILPYLARADLIMGEKFVKRCRACHNFGKSGSDTYDPHLYGVVGRKVAGVPGYPYSGGMKAKGGEWSVQSLSMFLTNPSTAVPGTKMGIPGLAQPENRAAHIGFSNKN